MLWCRLSCVLQVLMLCSAAMLLAHLNHGSDGTWPWCLSAGTFTRSSIDSVKSGPGIALSMKEAGPAGATGQLRLQLLSYTCHE